MITKLSEILEHKPIHPLQFHREFSELCQGINQIKKKYRYLNQ